MRGLLAGIVILIIFTTVAVLLWLREKKHTDKIAGELDAYYAELKEKRRTVRLNKRLKVVCRITEESNSHWSVFSKDISGEGICLYLPEILPENAVIDLDINLPDGKRISASGKVAWIKEAEDASPEGKRQFNAGIKFVRIRPKDKDVLVNFISSSLIR